MGLETVGEILASIWTVWAVLLFGGIVTWALWPANRTRFERHARIPLDDES